MRDNNDVRKQGESSQKNRGGYNNKSGCDNNNTDREVHQILNTIEVIILILEVIILTEEIILVKIILDRKFNVIIMKNLATKSLNANLVKM